MNPTQPFSASHVWPHRFDGFSMTIHLAFAGAIAGTYLLGLLRELGPCGLRREWLLVTHSPLGNCLIALAQLRIVWRMSGATHRAENTTITVARPVQFVLHGAMFGVPITGLRHVRAKGGTVSFLDLLESPPPLSPNRSIGIPLKGVHEVTADAPDGHMVLHAGAALLHNFILRVVCLRASCDGQKA